MECAVRESKVEVLAGNSGRTLWSKTETGRLKWKRQITAQSQVFTRANASALDVRRVISRSRCG